jgi:cytochrome c oxidase assembly protein subunit 15
MPFFRSLNLAALGLCFVVVVFGAYVRLSDAGLGCPDWPGCYGHLGVPDAAHEISAAEQQFPQRPVEAHKAWKEMIHRYLASTLGLLIVGLALISMFNRRQPLPRRLPWVLVALVIFQGLLGMWTVTWQLKPLAVSGHLLGGMSTLALLTWMWLTVRQRHEIAAETEVQEPDRPLRNERDAFAALRATPATAASAPVPRGLPVFAALGLMLVAGQIFLGGWTSSNYAALACPDLPTCHGQWWPETDVKEAFTLWRGLGVNYEHGVLDSRARVTIHLAHRLGAVVLTGVLTLLALFLLLQRARRWRRFGAVVLGALLLQLSIGLSIVKLQLPLLLADLHNAGAAVLLLSLVTLTHAAWTSPRI